jgi:hypothetical protein
MKEKREERHADMQFRVSRSDINCLQTTVRHYNMLTCPRFVNPCDAAIRSASAASPVMWTANSFVYSLTSSDW